MKFTVEVEDFYLDKDEDLIPALKREVTLAVTRNIWAMLKDRVKYSIEAPLIEKIRDDMDAKIREMLMDELENIIKKKVFKRHTWAKEETFEEYVEERCSKIADRIYKQL